MPGYVSDSRPRGEVKLSSSKVTENLSTGAKVTANKSFPPIQVLQRTTSWRTRGVSSQSEEEEWLKVTRNGFLTTDPVYDRGHTFWTCTDSVRLSHPYWHGRARSSSGGVPYIVHYYGPLIPRPAMTSSGELNFRFPVERRLTAAEIKKYGTLAISSTAPTAPSANLATATTELAREGIPQIPIIGNLLHPRQIHMKGTQDHQSALGRIGDEHLNVAFGWMPLVSDARSVITSLQSATKQARQLVRDSGKQVRRTFRFPIERDITHTINNANATEILFQMDSSMLVRRDGVITGPLETQVSTIRQRQIYFKGAFTYYMPTDKSLWSRIERYEQLGNKLLGTRLSPDAVWNLSAWSWLIDWFTDIGQIMANASRLSEDGLVLRYGYLMSHVTDEVHYTNSMAKFDLDDVAPMTAILRRESKERIKATPFGFGTPTASLTSRQWSILTSLGLTKGDRRLRNG